MTDSTLPKTLPLKAANGKTIDIPTVGYGTWASGDTSWAKDSAATALKEGYRHIDGAWYYGVTKPVGEAIRNSGIPREKIFWTSKAWPHFLSPENVSLALDKVLADSGLDYIDLFLAHWPIAQVPISRSALEQAFVTPSATPAEKGQATSSSGATINDWAHTSAPIAAKAGQQGSFVPTWKAMQQLVLSGKARAIGVSNFSIADLSDLLDSPDIDHSKVPISCNQIEVHPWLPQTDLINFHNKHGIVTTCYSPFAGQKADGKTLLKDPEILALAEKNDMDVGQLLQSWAVQRGTVPLGKSATPGRIKSNLQVRRLSEEDFDALSQMGLPNGEGRTVDLSETFGLDLF